MSYPNFNNLFPSKFQGFGPGTIQGPLQTTPGNFVLWDDSHGLNARDGGGPSDLNTIATGTTTSRSLANRAADYVTAEDFGAKGDGIHDDSLAINLAAASGKPVYFLPGKLYYVKSTINIQHAYSHGVYGGGGAVPTGPVAGCACILGSQNLAVVVNLSSSIGYGNGCSISHLAIGRKGTVSQGNGTINLQVQESQNNIISDCSIFNADIGVHFPTGAANTQFRRVETFGIYTTHYNILSNNIQFVWDSCTFGGSGDSITPSNNVGDSFIKFNGINIDTARVINCVFANQNSTNTCCVSFLNLNNFLIFEFIGNHVETVTGEIFFVDSTVTTLQQFFVTNNTLYDWLGSTKLISQGGADKPDFIIMTGNFFNGGGGTTFTNLQNSIITGNHFESATIINGVQNFSVITSNAFVGHFTASGTLTNLTLDGSNSFFGGVTVPGGYSNTNQISTTFANNVVVNGNISISNVSYGGQVVSLGPADSGGTGFRVLRVPN